MSDYIKIKCGNCENSFDLYQEELTHREHGYYCPFCYSEINEKSWNNLVNAFMTLHDWNYQTLKAHNEHNTGMFTAEIRNKHVPKHKLKI